jgi:hypothetical protein
LAPTTAAETAKNVHKIDLKKMMMMNIGNKNLVLVSILKKYLKIIFTLF